MIKRQNINKYFLLLSAFCVNTVYALPEDDYWITPEGTSGAKSITLSATVGDLFSIMEN
jgi:hypothetical protein